MHSSYAQHNYADVFKAIVSAFQPVKCIELGVLEGYSTIAIAKGLKENAEKGGARGHVHGYDLFDEYKYRNSSMQNAQANVDIAGVTDFVTLHKSSAADVAPEHEDGSVSLLHIDLSNCGDTVRWAMEQWDQKMVHGGIILFEGGTEERDQVEWMVKYNRKPMKPEMETNPIIERNYVFATYMKFPGLTCLLKKR